MFEHEYEDENIFYNDQKKLDDYYYSKSLSANIFLTVIFLAVTYFYTKQVILAIILSPIYYCFFIWLRTWLTGALAEREIKYTKLNILLANLFFVAYIAIAFLGPAWLGYNAIIPRAEVWYYTTAIALIPSIATLVWGRYRVMSLGWALFITVITQYLFSP